jgi:hypothetical protein
MVQLDATSSVSPHSLKTASYTQSGGRDFSVLRNVFRASGAVTVRQRWPEYTTVYVISETVTSNYGLRVLMLLILEPRLGCDYP